EAVQRAETLNVDGVGGKLLRGQLDIARSCSFYDQISAAKSDADKASLKADAEKLSKSGLQTLEQAVGQRPEYANAHLTLGRAYYGLMSYSDYLELKDKQKFMRAALEELKTAHLQAPTSLDINRLYLTLLMRKGDAESQTEAKRVLQTAM